MNLKGKTVALCGPLDCPERYVETFDIVARLNVHPYNVIPWPYRLDLLYANPWAYRNRAHALRHITSSWNGPIKQLDYQSMQSVPIFWRLKRPLLGVLAAYVLASAKTEHVFVCGMDFYVSTYETNRHGHTLEEHVDTLIDLCETYPKIELSNELSAICRDRLLARAALITTTEKKPCAT